ncbi:hypothetical protein HanIR_Chr17g0858251 [Helianthus annuus]|nr:hypothetical protein HanIR_Chr17g0858251 [Helianthus annuus]
MLQVAGDVAGYRMVVSGVGWCLMVDDDGFWGRWWLMTDSGMLVTGWCCDVRERERERGGGCRGCKRVVAGGGAWRREGVVVVASGGAWRDGDDVPFVDFVQKSNRIKVTLGNLSCVFGLVFVT